MKKSEVFLMIERHYRENREALVKELNNRLRNFHDAEDTVQEAYARACQYWSSLANPELFDHWFRVILSNCERAARKEIYLRGQTETHNPHKDTRHVENEAVDNLEKQDIENKIANRAEYIREPLRMYFFKGYSVGDIEKVFPIKYHTIRINIDRLKKELREDDRMGRGY